MLLNPTRDWFVSIVFCALLTFLFVGLSGFIFYQVGRGELFVATPTNALPTKIFDQKLLQEVVSFYRGKAEKFDELKRTKPHFTDPAE